MGPQEPLRTQLRFQEPPPKKRPVNHSYSNCFHFPVLIVYNKLYNSYPEAVLLKIVIIFKIHILHVSIYAMHLGL